MFHTNTWTSPGARVTMQADGNLVVYAVGSRALWHTWTFGDPGSRLVMQDDGNLVVYRPDGRPGVEHPGERAGAAAGLRLPCARA